MKLKNLRTKSFWVAAAISLVYIVAVLFALDYAVMPSSNDITTPAPSIVEKCKKGDCYEP